ncbi:24764_t:CDS:2, partial [Racocetra persica]
MSKTDAQFVSTTKEVISEFQQASININTDKSKNIWMSLFIKFCELRNYSNEIVELDNKTLSDQLGQFIVEVRKSNGISDMFEEIRIVNLFDKYQFKSLHRTLDGRMKSLANDGNKNHKQSSLLEIDEIKDEDAKRSWLNELDDGGMLLELPKEKNHAGGIKDPYAESGSSLIPSDISENIYTPVADIRKYLSKRPNNVVDDYFFVSINTSKKVYHGDWYLTSKLGKGLHNTMMHNICKDAKLDFKGRSITNHSMRSMGIHNLVELGITLDEQMIFSRHKTIAGVSAYQHQSLKRKRDNVSLLIPIDSTSNYINKGFSKTSDLLFSKFNEIDSEANIDSGVRYKKVKIPNITIENC